MGKNEKGNLDYSMVSQDFQNKISKLERNLHSWKLAFFTTFILLIGTFISIWQMANKSQIIPYVIEVNSSTGQAMRMNLAKEVNYSPDETNKSFFIKGVIKNMRFVPKDRILLGRNQKINLYYLDSMAKNKYLTFLKKEKLKTLLDEEMTRDIQILSFHQLAGTKNVYQARWEETIYSKIGVAIKREIFVGQFSTKIVQPKTIEELNNNPLGIIITDFSISKETEQRQENNLEKEISE